MAHLIQAEFFHGHNEVSIPLMALKHEMHVRENEKLIRAGIEVFSDLKTVVRFYDYTGMIGLLVQKQARARDRKEDAFLHVISARMLQRPFFKMCMIWHSARESVHREAVKAAVLKAATEALLSQKTAVERPDDHSFRSVRKDERYDIASRLKRIEVLWVFVFEENDLFADKNKLVTSITFSI